MQFNRRSFWPDGSDFIGILLLTLDKWTELASYHYFKKKWLFA